MKLSRRTALLAAAGTAVAPSAFAQKSAATLRIQFVDAVPNVDMYFNSQRTGLILAHQAWDMLVHRDPETFAIKPSLATEWKFAEDNSLDLTIRQGVKFSRALALVITTPQVIDEHLLDRFVVGNQHVAHRAAAHEVADFFGEILGMIPSTLQRLRHKDDLQAGLPVHILRILDMPQENQIPQPVHFGIGAQNFHRLAHATF